MELALIASVDEFSALRADWDALVVASDEDNPFRRWFWNHCWWKHFGHGRRLTIVTVRQSGQLIGLAPCFIQRDHWWRGARVVRFLGATEDVCSEHLGFLIQQGMEEQVTSALLSFFLEQQGRCWDVLRLTDLPESSRQVAEIDRYVDQHHVAARRLPDHVCRLVRFHDGWDAYLRDLSSKRRTKLRRIERELASHSVELAVAETADDLPDRWEELCRLHNLHWQTQGLRGCFEVPAFAAFHREIAEYYLSRNKLLLGSLLVDGKAVTSSYSVRLNDVAYEYQRGHDPDWIDRKAGHVLQFKMFRYAIERGVRCWDYLRGDYLHKRDWANDMRQTVEYQIAAPRKLQSVRLLLEERFDRAKDRLRKLRDTAHVWRNEQTNHSPPAETRQES